MAVVYVDETFSSGLTTSVDDQGRTSATATRVFNVFTQYGTDTDLMVKLDPRLPIEKTRHPMFPLLFCSGVTMSRKGVLHWEVTANYQSPPYRDKENGPLSQPTEVETFTITNEEAVDTDINGRLLTTANNETYQGVTKALSDLGIRLSRNFAFFDPATFYTYINAVNADTFFGFPAGVLRVVNISATQQYYEDFPYASVSVEIHARRPINIPAEKAWWKRIKHEGFYVRASRTSNRITRATDSAGKPVVTPVPLDDYGVKLAESADPTWRFFQIYDTVSFSSMGF